MPSRPAGTTGFAVYANTFSTDLKLSPRTLDFYEPLIRVFLSIPRRAQHLLGSGNGSGSEGLSAVAATPISKTPWA